MCLQVSWKLMLAMVGLMLLFTATFIEPIEQISSLKLSTAPMSFSFIVINLRAYEYARYIDKEKFKLISVNRGQGSPIQRKNDRGGRGALPSISSCLARAAYREYILGSSEP